MEEKANTCEEVRREKYDPRKTSPMEGACRESAKDLLRQTIFGHERVVNQLEIIEKMLPTELNAAQDAALYELIIRATR